MDERNEGTGIESLRGQERVAHAGWCRILLRLFSYNRRARVVNDGSRTGAGNPHGPGQRSTNGCFRMMFSSRPGPTDTIARGTPAISSTARR
jgi:hypothetical protein